TFRVMLFSIYSDEWKSFQSQHQTALWYKRRCCRLIPAESNSLPHAHAQTRKTYYKHQDSRIKKAQELKTKTSANSDIQDLPLRYQVYQGRLLASFQDDAKWVPTGKIFTSSTTKVDSEPPNGSNEDITNPYECEQALNTDISETKASRNSKSVKAIYTSFLKANSSSSTTTTPTNAHAEENNDNQADDTEHEFTNSFCTLIHEVDESSSCNIGNSIMHTFNQPQDFEYRWTKDHPLTQVLGNLSKPVQTRRQLANDP
ncbi:hypothetical protein Tco_1025707, partial [Tanacetum coccineum]